jgi:hypothetical protein
MEEGKDAWSFPNKRIGGVTMFLTIQTNGFSATFWISENAVFALVLALLNA